ncbi:hypothetical protein Bca52824_060407 [Brassica carinata]|uniref:Uncharacterized protein n=1 Tax=Brassica carinata TaxID=52824 RepID=A0A8X7QXG3_BRACI|nr:hypothetical protein Bca52824_060407 [Brassica carinata]
MEGFARGTTSWRDDETEESIEEEMCRVKREFKSEKQPSKSSLSGQVSLINLHSSTLQTLPSSLVGDTQLEGEKAQKKVEVQKLMEDNVKLTAVSDKKEAHAASCSD